MNKWLLAAVAALVAMGTRATMQPLLDDHLVFVFAFPAVVLVALLHGALPTLLTVALCALWAVVQEVPAPTPPEAIFAELARAIQAKPSKNREPSRRA